MTKIIAFTNIWMGYNFFRTYWRLFTGTSRNSLKTQIVDAIILIDLEFCLLAVHFQIHPLTIFSKHAALRFREGKNRFLFSKFTKNFLCV